MRCLAWWLASVCQTPPLMAASADPTEKSGASFKMSVNLSDPGGSYPFQGSGCRLAWRWYWQSPGLPRSPGGLDKEELLAAPSAPDALTPLRDGDERSVAVEFDLWSCLAGL